MGKVVGASPLIPFLTEHSEILSSLGIFFPFLFAAILKTAQGSSTVAITTTAGVVAPMLGALGFASPMLQALTVTAIGSGALVISHVNDSYFWVVTKFGRIQNGRSRVLLSRRGGDAYGLCYKPVPLTRETNQ